MAADAVSSTRDAKLAICRIVEETSGHETVKFFGPGCLVEFECTEFLYSLGTPKSNYFLVASNQVLRKDFLETLQNQETKEKGAKKRGPSVRMVAEFPGMKIGRKLERKPLNELYSNLKEDVFELHGITFLAVTKLKLEPASLFRKSNLLSRALEGNVSSLMTSDQLQCVVLCSERTIDRKDENVVQNWSTKVYDLLQHDSMLAHDESQFPSYFLRNEEKRRFRVEGEFQNLDGKPLGSIILNRDGKFGGVLNFIKDQPAPVLLGKHFDTAATSDRDYDAIETEMPVGASGGIYPLLNPQSKGEVGTKHDISKVAESAVTPLTRNQFVAGLTDSNKGVEVNSVDPATVVDGEKELQEKKDFANGKQSPTENSYRSFHFNSSVSKAEAEQDLKGEVLVIDLSPENVSKEKPAPEEQRAHTNNNNGEPSVQDPAEHLGDDDDDFSVERRNNNDRPLTEVLGGEIDEKRADPNDGLPQDRLGDGFHQGKGNERLSSFTTDLPKKVENPPVKQSTSEIKRKFGLGDPLAETLGSLEVLEAASKSLDKEYRYGHCKCWKHLAEFFHISKEEYESFNCNQVHSPTEVMFEYLESVMPHITVGDLKDGLAQIERQDVIGILIKHQNWNPSTLNDKTLVCSLFDSDPDIIGEMAVYLDKQKTGLKNWSHLAAKLNVPRKTFKTFETSNTCNPTEEFFEIVKVQFPELTVGELISHLEALERRDVINAIKSAKLSECSVIKDLIAEPDVMDTVCELLNTKKRTNKVQGLKHLGRKLGIKKEILDNLLPQQQVAESPTEALISHLGGKNPSLTLEHFIWALHFIDRPDVHAVLGPYLPDGCIPNLLKTCDCQSCKKAALKQSEEQL